MHIQLKINYNSQQPLTTTHTPKAAIKMFVFVNHCLQKYNIIHPATTTTTITTTMTIKKYNKMIKWNEWRQINWKCKLKPLKQPNIYDPKPKKKNLNYLSEVIGGIYYSFLIFIQYFFFFFISNLLFNLFVRLSAIL